MSFPVTLLIAFFAGLLVSGIPLWIILVVSLRKAHIDTLTGLPDYRAFQKERASRIRALNRRAIPFSLALIDLDGFHRFNEGGYDHGDAILQKFAKKLKAAVSPEVFCARFRIGDEFVLLYPPEKSSEVASTLETLTFETPFTWCSMDCINPKACSKTWEEDLQNALLLEKKKRKAPPTTTE